MVMPEVNWADMFGSLDRFLIAIAHQYGPFVYVALALIYMLQTGVVFMAFLPGDSLLFVAGAMAGGGHYRLDLLIVSLVVGTVVGNILNFHLGVWLGRKVLDGGVRGIDSESIARTHRFFERHGGKTVVLALFVPLLRSFAPLVAGAMKMHPTRFRLYTVLGATAWVGLFAGGGFFFGNIRMVREHLGIVLILGLVAALAGPLLVATVWKLLTGRVRIMRNL